MSTDKEFKEWFKKELLKQIDEQQKEIDLFEKALENDEDFHNFIEFDGVAFKIKMRRK
tara:strand:- start:1260 stop:1433 length:174 start_codon:yes stop_codon:yes gene_type:complete